MSAQCRVTSLYMQQLTHPDNTVIMSVSITIHLLTSRFSELNCVLILGIILNETDINNVFKAVRQINFLDDEPKFS